MLLTMMAVGATLTPQAAQRFTVLHGTLHHEMCVQGVVVWLGAA